MPIFSANISLLYTELPFIERFAAAKADGFEAVECQFPYEHSAGCTLADIVDKTINLALPMTLINLPAGDWAGGDRGIACDPQRVDEFKAGVLLAIKYAKALNISHVNCLAGIPPEGLNHDVIQTTLIANLTWAAEELEKEGIKLLIEPINTFDIPGFYLNRSQQAIDLIMAVKSKNLYLQYDAYHMHRMGEDVLDIEDYMPFIDHIQIADHPGRNEPGTGEIHFSDFFMLLDDLGYDGWVGCEYKKLHRANFFIQ
jgi:hydroxypyruvate isomerase